MSLIDIVDNSRTDKNTVHSYLPLYQQLLEKKKNSARNILEIGIFWGGSIKMWADFFTHAQIHALDVLHTNFVWDELKKNDRITLYTSTDAYNEDFFRTNFLDQNIKCDVLLDDGPHTLESMQQFIRLYSQIMTEDGILIIDDVQDWSWIEILKNEVPSQLKEFVKVYDLRPNKYRYDDIVFTIDLSNQNNGI
jgi:cephalosporin hydroxylase